MGENLGDLTTSSIIEVSGTLDRADSTIDADEVAILSQNGFYAAGQVTYVSLPPARQPTSTSMSAAYCPRQPACRSAKSPRSI